MTISPPQMKRRLVELSALNRLPLWIALATLAGLIYLGAAWLQTGRAGFPLDDAWIHQTYARNLGLRGEFAFTPGVPSAGSTAPLWSALLSIGYFLRLPYKLWTYGLGVLFLGLSGFSMARLGQRLFPDRLWLGPTIGLALVMEWHLIWAAVSGMETILFVWLSILLVERYTHIILPLTPSLKGRGENSPPFEGGVRGGWKFFQLGLIGGLLILVRPEGIGLIGLIGLHLIAVTLFKRNSKTPNLPRSPFDRLRAGSAPPSTGSEQALLPCLLALGAGALLPLLPYLAFNYSLTGLPLPNTFYAKQQEYAILLSNISLAQRWLSVVGVTLIGGQALLTPGLLKALAEIIKGIHHSWAPLAGDENTSQRSPVADRRPYLLQTYTLLALIACWWFSYLTLYAVRLPVTYQHGRYEIPTIPWLLLLGIWGVALLLRPRQRTLWTRVMSKTWFVSLMLAFPLFIALGAQAYANDVEFIETEMVKTAYWLRENTEPDAIIAAHDIGAIGYFTQRPLVDLAGLITPEVTPFIRDEADLLAFSRAQGARYLVTFPGWYPLISSSLFQVYSTNSSWAIAAGYDNMRVYQLESGD